MANEKIMNTRIQLKYDSYEKWQNSTVVLKAGEVAIAYLGETVSESIKGENRPVLFKVGDGVKTFANLPWASALAADVYDWAKKSEEEFIAWVNEQIEHPVESNDYGKVTADEGSLEADAIHDTFAIKGEGVVSTKAANDTITISVDLSEYAKTAELPEDENDITVVAEGTGIEVESATSGNTHTYTVSHQAKPTGGTAETATSGSGRTYVTEVLVDNLGHIAGVKTASETVVDTNTAHTHKNGSGIKLDLTSPNTNGGIDGEVKLNLNIAMELDNKTIKIYDKDDTDKTAIATLDATDFIKDGMIESVELVEEDADGKEGQFLKITWNIDNANGNDADSVKDVIYLDVTKLVDIYTGGTTDDITVSVSNTNVITATLNKNFALASDLTGYKTKQNSYTAEGSTVKTITKVEQTANGEVSVTYSDIAFPAAPDYTDEFNGKKDKQENKSFTGSTIKTVTGVTQDTNGEIDVTFEEIDFPELPTADDFGVLSVNGDEGITVDNTDAQNPIVKITDRGVTAEKTAAFREDDGSSAEVWVFYCGSATELV